MQRFLLVCVFISLSVFSFGQVISDFANQYWWVEATRKNHVYIYNRWGDVVFDMENYDNQSKVFNGLNNNGNEVPSGIYFYKIEFTSGKKSVAVYLEVKK